MRYKRLSAGKALCIQAIGSERAEAVCDMLCDDIKKEYAAQGYTPVARFSPGYADLPLSLQRDIFKALDCPRTLGITLSDGFLMSPTKSVTAIVGLKKIQ
jgi:cobalamin-dependent methionine synthase I